MVRKVVIGILAAVGVLAVLDYLVPRHARFVLLPGWSFHSFPSPDAKYKAVYLIDAGGAAGSGYCNAKILIIPESLDERKAALEPNQYRADEGRYDVFAGPCDSFSDHEASPKLKWASDTSLEITLSINSSALFAEDFSLKKLDDSKQVNVKYVIGE